MRFKDYILEQDVKQSGTGFHDALSQIKVQCKSYLEKNPTYPIYRGVPARFMKMGFTPHPTERQPRDSGKGFNFAFNAGYQLAHKVPSVRTRTVFATGKAIATVEYGELGFFFPVGDFKFGWSTDIADSYDDEEIIDELITKHFRSMHIGSRPNQQDIARLLDDLAHRISPAQWLNNRNDEGEDVTLAVSSEQPQNALFLQVKNIYTKLVESLRNTFDTLYIDNEDLEAAVKSGHEILFYKTDGYYMIPYSEVQLHMTMAGLEGTHYNRQQRYDWLLEQIKDAT